MAIIALICYLLQATLLGYVEIYGIKPNLIIITTISYALIRGKEEGAAYGAFAGLLLDILGGKTVGVFAIMGMYLGLSVGWLHSRFYKENYVLPALLTAGGTFIYNFIYYFFGYFISGRDQVIWFLGNNIIPEAIYNGLLSIIIYFIILYINKKFDYYNRVPRVF